MRKFLLWSLAVSLPLAAAAEGAAVKKHTVAPKDCLWQLAKTYYGNPFRWKVIYAANQALIKDPHWIYVGQVFEIPETPDAAIGELGARPIETAAKVTEPPAEPVVAETAPALAPAPTIPSSVPKPAPKPAPAPAPVKAPDADFSADDLSDEMPKSLTGQYPSLRRIKQSADWSEDGRIVTLGENEGTAAQGDTVNAALGKDRSAFNGDRFTVYRRDSTHELEEEKGATYLEVIGTVEVKKYLGHGQYSLVVLTSGDSVQPGDLIKKGGL